jgi:predicted dithiol-disulfide oxidoreductase (DUF899 family)
MSKNRITRRTFVCFYSYRSGEFASDYEKKKQEMQQADEDTTFNYQKKKVNCCCSRVLL